DGVLRHRSHLVFQLRELGGGKPGVEPLVVCFEVELGDADEEVRGPEAFERRQPAAGALEVALEDLDVGRLRGDEAPSEDADPPPLRHGAAHRSAGKLHRSRAEVPVKTTTTLLALALLVCACGKERPKDPQQQQTQTIAPATAKPDQSGTDTPMTETVEVDDSRSEGEGGTAATPAKPAPAPAKKTKKH